MSNLSFTMKISQIQHAQSTDFEKLTKFVDETFKKVKHNAKMTFYNSLIKVKLQSEGKTIDFLSLINSFVRDCYGIEKMIIICKKNDHFDCFDITSDLQFKPLEVKGIHFSENFDKIISLLKSEHQFSSEHKSLIQDVLESIGQTNIPHRILTSDFKLNLQNRIKILCFFVSKSQKVKFFKNQTAKSQYRLF